MRVEEIMSKSVVTIKLDDSLKVVKDIFDKTRFHHLLVVESGKLLGVVSDRDLLKALSPYLGTVSETTRDVAGLNKHVHQIMTRKPMTLKRNAGLDDAIHVFTRQKFSCIPIVDDEEKPVGIVTWRDLLKTLEPS